MEILLAMALLMGSPEGKDVPKLGARSFRVRQAAESRLAGLGDLSRRMTVLPAFDWLALSHGDPEVAMRCRRLAAGIRDDRLKMYQDKASKERRILYVVMDGETYRVCWWGQVDLDPPVGAIVPAFVPVFRGWLPCD